MWDDGLDIFSDKDLELLLRDPDLFFDDIDAYLDLDVVTDVDTDVDVVPDVDPELDVDNLETDKFKMNQFNLKLQWEKDLAKVETDKVKAKIQKAMNEEVNELIDKAPKEDRKNLIAATLNRKDNENQLTKVNAEVKKLQEKYKKKLKKLKKKNKRKAKKGKELKTLKKDTKKDFINDLKLAYDEVDRLTKEFNTNNEAVKTFTEQIVGEKLAAKIETLELKLVGVQTKKAEAKKTPLERATASELDISKQVELDAAAYKIWKAGIDKDEKDEAAKKKQEEEIDPQIEWLENELSKDEKELAQEIREDCMSDYFKLIMPEVFKPADTKPMAREMMTAYLDGKGDDDYVPLDQSSVNMLIHYMLKGKMEATDYTLIIKFVDKYVTERGKFNDTFGYETGLIKPTTYSTIMKHDTVKKALLEGKEFKPVLKDEKEKWKKGYDKAHKLLSELANPVNIKQTIGRVLWAAGKTLSFVQRGFSALFTKQFWRNLFNGDLKVPEFISKTKLAEFSDLTKKNDHVLDDLKEMERRHTVLKKYKDNAGDKSDRTLIVKLPTDREGLAGFLQDVIQEGADDKSKFDALAMFHAYPNHYHAALTAQREMDATDDETEKRAIAWAYYQDHFTGDPALAEASTKYFGGVFNTQAQYNTEVYDRGLVFNNLPAEARSSGKVVDPEKMWENLGKVYKKAAIQVIKDRYGIDQAKEYFDYYIEEMVTKPVTKIVSKPYVWIPAAAGAAYPVGKAIYDSFSEGDYTALGAVSDFYKLDKKWSWDKSATVGSHKHGSVGTFSIDNRPIDDKNKGTRSWFGTSYANTLTGTGLGNSFKFSHLNSTDKKKQFEALHLNLNFTNTNYLGQGWSLKSNAYMQNTAVLGNAGNESVDPTASNYGEHSDLSSLAIVATDPSVIDWNNFLDDEELSLNNLLNRDETNKRLSIQPNNTVLNSRFGIAETLNKKWNKTASTSLSLSADMESYNNFALPGQDLQAYRLKASTSTTFGEDLFGRKNTSLTFGGSYTRQWTNDLPDDVPALSEVLALNIKFTRGSFGISASYKDDLLKNGQFTSWDFKMSNIFSLGAMEQYGTVTGFVGLRRTAAGATVPAYIYPTVGLMFTPLN